MSATLQQIHDLAVGAPALRQRFAAARLKAAWDVLNENAGTANHTARRAWADKIIAGFDADLDREYRRFLSNPTIQTTGNAATDGDVQFVVNSFINTYAAG